jgi:mobilization protein NikA
MRHVPFVRRMPSREFLKVDLLGLRAQLLTWCGHKGLSQSEAVRRWIRTGLSAASTPTGGERIATDEPPLPHVRRRITARFTEREVGEIQQRAREAGLSTSRCLAYWIRSNVHSPSIPQRALIEALTESNYQLAAIGRNINQIARALNQDAPRSQPEHAARLEQFQDQVREHLIRISAVVAAIDPKRSNKGAR